MAIGHTLWDIGQARLRHEALLALLDRVIADAAEEPAHGGIGLHDRAYVRLNAFQGAIARLDPPSVAGVAGEEAGRALQALEAGLVALRRDYSMGVGPDRDLDGAKAAAARLSEAAELLRDDFGRYAAAVAGLRCPDAIPERMRSAAPPRPVRTVPHVPRPRPREATTAMARTVLGETYVTLAVAHVEASVAGEVGLALRGDLAALSGRLGTWTDAIAYRASAADVPFADAVRVVSESLDNILDAVMAGRGSSVSPGEALERCVGTAALQLCRVDQARTALGHADPGPGLAGPRP